MLTIKVKETTMNEMIDKTKQQWLYRFFSCIHKDIAEGYLESVKLRMTTIAAYAEPKEATIYVRTDIPALPQYMIEALIRHEEGHIVDYIQRGRIRFYITVLTSYIQKSPIMKSMATTTSLEEANKLTLKYHNTKIERLANELAGLDPKVFLLDEASILQQMIDNGEITQEQYDEMKGLGE
jgi:hypothetical protein